MNNFNYTAWFERANVFTARWDREPARVASPPVCSEAEIRAVEEQLGKRLPEAMTEFFRACGAANGFLISTTVDDWWIHGGGRWNLANVPDMYLYQCEIASWYEEDSNRTNAGEMAAFLRNSLPLIGNVRGDYVSLDLRNGESQPVGLFCHDMEGWPILSPSLPEFLQEWELCGYCALDFWTLPEFCTAEGILSGDTAVAGERRELLQVARATSGRLRQ